MCSKLHPIQFLMKFQVENNFLTRLLPWSIICVKFQWNGFNPSYFSQNCLKNVIEWKSARDRKHQIHNYFIFKKYSSSENIFATWLIIYLKFQCNCFKNSSFSGRSIHSFNTCLNLVNHVLQSLHNLIFQKTLTFMNILTRVQTWSTIFKTCWIHVLKITLN